jgi:hypothetical protein
MEKKSSLRIGYIGIPSVGWQSNPIYEYVHTGKQVNH